MLLFRSPQCLPCTPVSMCVYCPIRRPSSTFMPFHCWSIFSTLRDQQHHKKSLDTAGLHSILEPVGLDRGDDRRPDGVTSFPFKGGKALAWDATFIDSFSASNLYTYILHHSEPRFCVKRGRGLEETKIFSTCGRLRICSSGC